MEKNWLIRTKSNHILGPVSKDKVKDLVQSGSLKSEDEICMGNGYWFFIREKDLLDKYLWGDELQSFNPVSEVESKLTLPLPNKEENLAIPSEADLEYPTIEVEEKNNDQNEENKEIDSEDNISYIADHFKKSENTNQTQGSSLENKVPQVPVQVERKSFLNSNVLTILGFLLLFLAIMGFYFRKRVLKQFLEVSSISFISTVHAQTHPDHLAQKKN
jgi:hypothetical protein